MNSVKLFIPLHSLYWSIHTKDESKRRTAFAFIFGVNWLWRCGVKASLGVFIHEIRCNGMTIFMELKKWRNFQSHFSKFSQKTCTRTHALTGFAPVVYGQKSPLSLKRVIKKVNFLPKRMRTIHFCQEKVRKKVPSLTKNAQKGPLFQKNCMKKSTFSQ